MIHTRYLVTREDFMSLKKGDVIACEFHRDVHDHPRKYRFGVFTIVDNKERDSEIILQKRNNIYFNWKLFLGEIEGESNLKQALLLSTK